MKITIKENNSEKIVIALCGELNTLAAEQIREEMGNLLPETGKHVIFDFTELKYISSSGLRIILQFNKNAVAKGGKVSIIGMSEDIKQIFQLVGFDQLFENS